MTLMSLVLWSSSSADLQIMLMLCHYIIWGLFNFLYRFLHWIFICNANVIHVGLVYSVRGGLTRFERGILYLRRLFPTDTPIVIPECWISEMRRGIYSESSVVWIALENLYLTPFYLLTCRLQDLLEAYCRVGCHWIRCLLWVIGTCMLSVH